MKLWKVVLGIILTLAIMAGVFFGVSAILAKKNDRSVIDEIKSWTDAPVVEEVADDTTENA